MAVGDYQDRMEELYGSEEGYQQYMQWKMQGVEEIKEPRAKHLALQAALREALDGWEAEMHADLTGHQRKRIDTLRAQFLDDK
jgi:hypothetical protein